MQKLLSVKLRNLRSLRHFSCSFDPRINEIVGDNGQGKTTLLESLFLLVSGSSFRSALLKDLVTHDERGFIVEIDFEKEGQENELKCVFDGTKKQLFYNRAPCSQQMLLGLLNATLFTSQDNLLIQGPPATRRRFLDLQIAQANPLFVHHFVRYQRALKQRNALIKSKQLGTIKAWEKELAASGAYIVQERRKTISSLEAFVMAFFKNCLTNFPGPLALQEITGCPQSESVDHLAHYFEEEFQRKRAQEMVYGHTLVGPHRHDLLITAKAKRCDDFASEGEIRVIALALRFAEWQLLKERVGEAPLFLADDLGAHLDSGRLHEVTEMLSQLGQVVVTGQKLICNHSTLLQLPITKNS